MATEDKIPIYQGVDYLVEYSRGSWDYPSKWKELKGENVIDFLKELNENRDVSDIEVFRVHETTDEDGCKDENCEKIYLISYMYDSPRYGLYKVYRKMVAYHVHRELSRWRREEKEGKINNVQLRRLELITKHSINWFFRDFAKSLEHFDHSTIKKSCEGKT